MRARLFLFFWATVLLGVAPAGAQAPDSTAAPDTTAPDTAAPDTTSGFGAGFEVVLTNSGFGLGGFGSRTAGPGTTLILETHLAAGKDAREAAFLNRFGRQSIPNKANYLLLLPVRLGMQRRLLRAYIEDNFRPYVHLTAGPTLSWQYPYFDDQNGNLEQEEGEELLGQYAALGRGKARVGFGATLAVGARFGSERAVRSLRVGYAFTYFPEAVQLLEPSVRGAQRYFGTPTITLMIGRVW